MRCAVAQTLPSAATTLVIGITKIDLKPPILQQQQLESDGTDLKSSIGAAEMLQLLEVGQAWASPVAEKKERHFHMCTGASTVPAGDSNHSHVKEAHKAAADMLEWLQSVVVSV